MISIYFSLMQRNNFSYLNQRVNKMRFLIVAITCLISTQAISASWNFKSNVDLSPPYNKCLQAIANGKDMGKGSLKIKNNIQIIFMKIIFMRLLLTVHILHV